MRLANINGVTLRYEVLGASGPWMALSPGGRREMGNVRGLAQRMADAGYRVLIHDRRNCGASECAFDGSRSEYEVWADDLVGLLRRLNATPAIVGGGSSGARLALLYAQRFPRELRALLLWRITGGAFAARRLVEQYYDQYVRAAEQGGMAAVAETEHFRERILANPRNRQILAATDRNAFIAAMKNWRADFLKDAEMPVIGASEKALAAIKVPTCLIPGNDRTHSHAIGEAAHRLIPGSELHDLWPGDLDIDLFPADEWAAREAAQAGIFADFLRRRLVAA